MFGISLLQSRMASPLHICWASQEKARHGDVVMPITEKASTKSKANWVAR